MSKFPDFFFCSVRWTINSNILTIELKWHGWMKCNTMEKSEKIRKKNRNRNRKQAEKNVIFFSNNHQKQQPKQNLNLWSGESKKIKTGFHRHKKKKKRRNKKKFISIINRLLLPRVLNRNENHLMVYDDDEIPSEFTRTTKNHHIVIQVFFQTKKNKIYRRH